MGMKNVEKYTRQYFMPPVDCMDWAKKDHIEKAPIWCSVDLRDGNQALDRADVSGTEAGIFQTPGSVSVSKRSRLVSRQLPRQSTCS